jgi:hypothetical protein
MPRLLAARLEGDALVAVSLEESKADLALRQRERCQPRQSMIDAATSIAIRPTS